MFGNFFGPREDGQHEAQMSEEAGELGQGPESQPIGNNAQSSFQDANWNGLSPLNKDNQLHYQTVREQAPADYESDEWPECDIEQAAPQTRKRHGSQQLANDYPSKRVYGSEIFTPQRKGTSHSARRNTPFQDTRLINRGTEQYGKANDSPGQYSQVEFQLPPPIENIPRRSSWMGPDIPNGERWGSVEGGGFGQMFPPQMALQQQPLKSYNRNDPIYISGGTSANLRRGQSVIPDTLRGMTMAQGIRHGYRAQSPIDLITPESVHRRRQGAQTSTNSGSSGLRRATETEPTDFENDDWDSDAQDYKSSRFQSYIPGGRVAHDTSHISHSNLRAESVAPDTGRGIQSQLHQPFNDGGHRYSPAYAQGSFRRQSFNASSMSHSYNLPAVPQFGQIIKTENNYSQNTPSRGVSRQPTPISLHRSRGYSAQRHADVEPDSECDESDTIENIMRRKAWEKKVKDADNASSRDTLSKPRDFGGSQRNVLGYSSQEVETYSKVREERQESTLSRIRGPDSSKTNKQSSLSNISTLLENGDVSRHVVIKQTAAQKAKALEKEKAELRRQKLAEETIAQRQKQAQKSKDINDLFEEAPIDEAALARIKRSKEIAKARKYAQEEAKIVEDSDKKLQKQLAAARKKRAAEEQGEKKAEKKRKAEEDREREKKRDAERLQARRISAAETLRIKQVVDEEMRVAGLEKLQAERQASKKRAATLQSFKITDSKPSSAGNVIPHKEPKWAEDSGNLSDGGMFVSDDVVPLRDELPKEQPAVGADKEPTFDKPGNVQILQTVPINDKPASGQEPDDVADDADVTLTAEAAVIQKPDTIADKPDPESSVAPPASQKPDATEDNGRYRSPTAALGVEKPEIAHNGLPSASNTTFPRVGKVQVPATTISGASISAVASDGRRRPPEISRPRIARRRSPDPIRFTGSGRTTCQDTQDSDHATTSTTSHARRKSQNRTSDKAESQVEAKLRKTIKEVEELKAKAKAEEVHQKKEWDVRMKQLSAILIPQDREDIAAIRRRTSSGKNHNVTSEAGKDNQIFTSQINFVSTIESQAREKQKAEEARLAKFEKDKATCRRRYDREIRIVLNGQGVELDHEKISKQVDEKMAVWEVCRIALELHPYGTNAFIGEPP